MKPTMHLITAVAAASVLVFGSALAQQQASMLSVHNEPGEQVVQTVNSVENEMIGRIDWENNIVYAVGDGVPPQNPISAAQGRVRSKRAAIDQAFARLLETVQEVRVDAESTTRNFVNESNIVRTSVSGMIQNAEIVEMRQFDDGSYQVMMAMPMGGPQGLNATLLPTQMAQLQQARMVTRVTRDPAPAATAPATQPQLSSADTAQQPAASVSYTGLIIDTKGHEAAPAAFPRIISQSGDILYDLGMVDPNAATNGMSAYRKSLDAARQLARAGNNPLVVEAVDVAGRNRTDLVLSDEDAAKLLEADAAGSFLYDAHVIVVID